MEDDNTGSRVKVPVKKPPRERKKRSSVWGDYEVSRNGDGKKIANCKKCRQELVAESTDGTSHLKRHQMTCPRREDGAPLPIAIGAPPEASNCGNPADSEEATAGLAIPPAAPPPIDDAQPEPSSCSMAADWEEATADLARMIALHGYDPSIVEDSYFKSFVRRLNPDFQVPSQAAIEDICDGVCDEAEKVLESALESNSSQANLVVDTTETALGRVLYAAYHFIDDDWNRRQMVLHVNMDLPEGMETLPLCVRGFSLEDDVHVEELGEIIYNKIPIKDCIFSKMIGVGDLDYFMDVGYWIISNYNHYDVFQTVASFLYGCTIVRYDVLDVHYDSVRVPVTRQERERFYSQNGLHHLRPYDKQWYSWYCSVRVLQEHDYWSLNIFEQRFCHVLGEIYRAIKTISDPHHPTSHIVLRELLKVRETLRSEIAQVNGDEEDLYEDIGISKGDIVHVLAEAEEILAQSIKENYLQWSTALVLDPRYKLKYIRFIFSRAFSSEAEECISKITKKIRRLFTYFSRDVSERSDGDPIHGTEMTSAASAHQLEQAWGEHRRRSEVTKTELDRYLESPLIDDTDGLDILNWWKLNSSFYPTLARIARAALAMPTCRKLSSEQMSQITSRVRGYSKGKLRYC